MSEGEAADSQHHVVMLCCLTVPVSLILWQQESSLGTAGPARGQESALAQSRAGKHQTTSALAAHRPLPIRVFNLLSALNVHGLFGNLGSKEENARDAFFRTHAAREAAEMHCR